MNVERSLLPIQAESASTTLAKQLLASWKDPEYRAEFVRERTRSSVALQIRALREQRNGMTQKQLGDAIGKAQTWISVLEDPEYGKMSVATLLNLADAFGVDLEIKFRPFSRTLYELTKQNADYFQVRSFEEELPDLENAESIGWIVPSGKWSDIVRATQLLTYKNPIEPLIKAAASASGAIEQDMRVPSGEYGGSSVLTKLKSAPSKTVQENQPTRYRRQSRLARRKEIWQKRKLPKRQENNSQVFSGAGKTMNPYTQIMFTFNQASGT
jgi:transcriptional regulator with XRE-family HTH domain